MQKLTERVVTVPLLGPVLCTSSMFLQMGTGFACVKWLLQDGPAPSADCCHAGFGTAWPLRPLTNYAGHSWGERDRADTDKAKQNKTSTIEIPDPDVKLISGIDILITLYRQRKSDIVDTHDTLDLFGGGYATFCSSVGEGDETCGRIVLLWAFTSFKSHPAFYTITCVF